MGKANIIEEYLADFEKTSTKRIYRGHLNNFFEYLEVEPEEYFDNGRDYNKDLLDVWRSTRHQAPCTRAGKITCIKCFLEENDIIIQRKTWKKIKRQKKTIPKTIDHVPTVSELKQILQHGGVKERALLLVLASSGMRIGEALKLKTIDIELHNQDGKLCSPAKIIIRQEVAKNDTPRICFISNEARDALIEWLRIRKSYLKKVNEDLQRRKIKKDISDDRIFPFAWATAWQMWYRLLRKSGFDKKDESTNRYEVHIHTLRKFMINRLKGVIRIDAVEQLVGHEGYLSRAYRDLTEETLKAEYLKGMQAVSIFEKTADLTEVNESMKHLQTDNAMLKQEVFELRQLISKMGNKKLEEGKKLQEQYEEMKTKQK